MLSPATDPQPVGARRQTLVELFGDVWTVVTWYDGLTDDIRTSELDWLRTWAFIKSIAINGRQVYECARYR